MFYFELFKVAIIGVTSIVLVNMFIYKILIEYDKSVKVRGYKKKKGFFPKFSRLLFTISYIAVIVGIGFPIFAIIAVYCFFKGSRVENKRFELTFKSGLAQAFIIIGIVEASIKGLYAALYYFDAPKSLIIFYRTIGTTILYFSIVFWIILCIKQTWYLRKEGKKSLNLMTEKYEGLTDKEKCTKIDEDYDEKTFNDTYCVMYDTEEEWYNSPETQKTFGFYYKLFQVYSPIWILLINLIIGIIYFDILPRSLNSLDLDNGITPVELIKSFNLLSWDYYIAGTIVACSLMIYGALSYILIPLATPKHKHTKKEKIVMRLLQVILLGLIIFSGIKYYEWYKEDISDTENNSTEYSIDQYQKLISDALKNEDNLEGFTFAQKVQYLTSNSRNEGVKLKALKYEATPSIPEEADEAKEESIYDFLYDQDNEDWLKVVGEKKYYCNREECSINIPLSNSKFNHILIYENHILVHYPGENRNKIYISTEDYTEEKGEYYLSKLKPELSNIYSGFDFSNILDEDRNKLLIVAFEIGENESLYKNNINEIDNTKELEQKLNDIYEAYQITVEEVNKLFEEVTSK